MSTADPSTSPAPSPSGDAPLPPSEPAERTFSQAELDRIVQERLARAKPADYDDLRKAADELAELKKRDMSDAERLKAELDSARQTAETATARMRSALKRSAVVAAATRAGAIDPDAVLALLPDEAVTVGDDGHVTGVDDAVKALLAEKPYLVGTASTRPAGNANGGPRGDQPPQWTREDLKNKSPEQIDAARRAGLLSNLLSG